MKRILIFAVLALIAISTVSAETIEVSEFEYVTGWQAWFQPFAIYTDQPNYDPGEWMNLEVATTVPCSMDRAFLRIYSDAGSVVHSSERTSKFYPCTSGYATFSAPAPSTPDDYRIELQFLSSYNEFLYTDKAWFSVGQEDVSCPNDYQSSWQTAYKVSNGEVQERSTYEYGSAPECELEALSETRTVCETGFEPQGNSCVSTEGNPVCGNGVVEGGEECDLGSGNDVCPSNCDLTCSESVCDDPNAGGGQEPGDGEEGLSGVFWTGLIAIAGAAVLLFGIILLAGALSKRR